MQKLDAWADDLKLGLENDLKEIDREIKVARNASKVAASLEDKLDGQSRLLGLESRRHSLRRQLFDAQDEIDKSREKIVDELRGRLGQSETIKTMFVIQWRMI